MFNGQRLRVIGFVAVKWEKDVSKDKVIRVWNRWVKADCFKFAKISIVIEDGTYEHTGNVQLGSKIA